MAVRSRGALLGLTVGILSLLALTPLASAKVVVGAFGPNGTLGGQFAGSIKVAINNTGAGGVPAGTVYVADNSNNRIQRLSPTGAFQRAWGFDVDASNPSTGFEICTVAADCKQGTNSTTAALGGQLGGPQGIDIDQVTGHVYVTESANRRVSQFDANGNFIRTWGADVLLPSSGSTFEICSVAAECKTAASAGANGGQFANTPRALKLDPFGNVWVADTANRRFQKFDASGNFIAVYGYGVNGGTDVESCTSTAAGVCKQSPTGSVAGQFGGTFSPFDFAFDSAGNLYANDGGNPNNRILKFAAAMTSATTFATVPSSETNAAIFVLPSGNVLIGRNVSGSGRQLLELDTAGGVVEISLAGTNLPGINSLARNTSNGRIYLASPSNTTTTAQASLLILDDGTDPPPPGMTIDPVTTKTATTASFSGMIDPLGATIANCSFQYSTSESFAGGVTSVPVSGCSSLAPGGGPQPVSASASGLVPNTNYFVRLAVNRLFIAGTATTGAQSFTTDPTTPAVSNVGAVQIADTSAQLVGTINPNNSGALGYVFQYGTTPALGSSTAVAPLASGSSPTIISQTVSDLSPGTLYYVKLVATNLTGTESAAATFSTRSEPLPLPDRRAYEMVSPPDKSGGGALSGSAVATVSENGQAIQFNTTSLFGDPGGVQMFRAATYVSKRSDSGWQSFAATPSACRAGPPETDATTVGIGQEVILSANLDISALVQPESEECVFPPLSPSAPLPAENLYRHEFGSQSYELLTPARAFDPGFSSVVTFGWGGYPIGFSADFGHIVYESTGNQTPDAPSPGGFMKIYEWDNGVLRLVSRDTGNIPFSNASRVPAEGSEEQPENSVSLDGQRIFFQNPDSTECSDPNCELYLREDGNKTYHVSQSECTSACGESQPDRFTWASPDGSRALFTSAAKLTDDTNSTSGANLYMFRLGSNPTAELNNLTLLSRDAEPADGTKAEVRDAIGASDDGTTVFFVANGQIIAGAPISPGPKVYRWRWNGGVPTVDYLATLNSNGWGTPPNPETVDSLNWIEPQVYVNTGLPREGRIAYERVTPDGRYLLLSTVESLSPVADTDSTADLYRWSQEDGFVCVTCQSPGVPSEGDSTGPGPRFAPIRGRRMVAMTDDGQRIFFTTGDRLVPQDTNGAVRDVYEWHDGVISLLSSGMAPSDSKLLGAGRDGKDVFIYTEERLVGWDSDSAGDIYDVRVGGGFPEPPPLGAGCEGETCRAAGTQPPASIPAGTAGFEGPGNTTGRIRCPKGTRKTVTKSGRTVCKKKAKNRGHRGKSRHHRAGSDRRAAR